VVAALHDLNHAAMFCDRIAVMQGGRLVALGRPQEVLTRARIHDVFGVDVRVDTDADGVCHIRFLTKGVAPRQDVPREKPMLMTGA
ncbi:MAG: hypothetical protein ACK4N1_14365, partial [Pseudorhizobium sp.]